MLNKLKRIFNRQGKLKVYPVVSVDYKSEVVPQQLSKQKIEMGDLYGITNNVKILHMNYHSLTMEQKYLIELYQDTILKYAETYMNLEG